jgi:hypothetical protein
LKGGRNTRVSFLFRGRERVGGGVINESETSVVLPARKYDMEPGFEAAFKVHILCVRAPSPNCLSVLIVISNLEGSDKFYGEKLGSILFTGYS